MVTMQFEIEESFKIKIELMIDRDLRELFGSGKNEGTETGAGREEQSGKHNIGNTAIHRIALNSSLPHCRLVCRWAESRAGAAKSATNHGGNPATIQQPLPQVSHGYRHTRKSKY